MLVTEKLMKKMLKGTSKHSYWLPHIWPASAGFYPSLTKFYGVITLYCFLSGIGTVSALLIPFR